MIFWAGYIRSVENGVRSVDSTYFNASIPESFSQLISPYRVITESHF